MALSADVELQTLGETRMMTALAGAADTLYKGAIVNLGVDGYAKVAADVKYERPFGVVKKNVVAAGANAENVEIERGIVRLAHTGAAVGDVGALFYATDDATLADAAVEVEPLGMCVAWEAGFLWIDMNWKAKPAVPGSRMIRSGSQAVTGSELGVDTGLTVIEEAFVTVKDTNQSAADAAYATADHGADGLLDIYCWDDAGAAAGNAAAIDWLVVGT